MTLCGAAASRGTWHRDHFIKAAERVRWLIIHNVESGWSSPG